MTKACSCFALVFQVWVTGTVGRGVLVRYYGSRSLELTTVNPVHKEALLQSAFEGLEWFLVPSLLVKPSLEGPAKYWSSPKETIHTFFSSSSLAGPPLERRGVCEIIFIWH